MRLTTSLSMVLLGVLAATGASAADWASDSVGYRYYSAQSEPGTADKVAKNVLSYTHVSGDKLGMNLFTIDYLRSDNADPANGSAGGAAEWYGFYKRSFSLRALSGSKTGFGLAKDLSLTARVDAGAKNTQFAPAPFKLRVGVAADMPVSAGFWNIGLEAYKENNNNGIVGKQVNFDTAAALSSAWSIPVSPIGASFDGFLDVIGPKGKDGFGVQTATETLLRATLMFNVGGEKSGLQAGFGVEYWNNKFGCDNSGSTVANSCKSTSPMLLLSYKL